MEDVQKGEFAYFLEHHDELYTKYPNKHIVLQGQSVLFDADSFEDALEKALDAGLKVGTFIIQLCTPGEEGYTQTFHSRVKFA